MATPTKASTHFQNLKYDDAAIGTRFLNIEVKLYKIRR